MSTQEYIEELKKLKVEDKMLIVKSLQEDIEALTGNDVTDPAVIEVLLKRQQNVKSGLVKTRPWSELKKELLK